MTNIEKKVKEYFINKSPKKYFAVMLFFTEIELGISNIPNKWVNTNNLLFDNGLDAITAYTNIKCPASQLIDAMSQDELINQMNIMSNNFNNNDWLINELYPSL